MFKNSLSFSYFDICWSALSWSSIVVDWTVFSQNLYVEALTPNVAVFEDRDFKEVFRDKWGHKNGP